MANCSDAFGTFTVERVGKEFIEFLESVQANDNDAYYKLAEPSDFRSAVVNKDGDTSFNFSTMGRWSYGNNLEGYLDGAWVLGKDADHSEYDKLIKAIKEKNGKITVEYSDSDPAMDWMGQGVATVEVVDGHVVFNDDFNSENIDVIKYAKMNDMDIFDAMQNLHGDEPAVGYEKYTDECKEKGVEPKDPNTWYDEDFEWE